MSPPVPLHRPGSWAAFLGHGRLALVCCVGGAWLVLLVFRLFWLQVEKYDHYVQKAEEQQQRVVELDPPRGTIFDARGRTLAVSVEVESIAAHPSAISDPDRAAEILAKGLALEPRAVREKLGSDRGFVWIRRKVDRPVAEALKAELEQAGISGIDFLPESKRYYPMRELAAQVLGYVGTDNLGLAGLEYRYEKDVATEKGSRTVLLDGLNGTVIYPNLDRSEARPGSDLHLTLDAAIQHIVERELESAVTSSGAERGMALMLDPRTGAIRAMATYPTYDPNEFNRYPKERWRNAPVTDAYEPGSTFKMVTLAAALEANAVDALQTFFCGNGQIVLGRTLIRDHKPFGELSVREIMAKSSNVGAIKLGQVAGRERFYATIEAFGFGKTTGIDLPSESAGLLRPLERWSPITPAYVSFGQGISVTTLQQVVAFAAVANGGHMLLPYVVDSVGEARSGVPRREVRGLPIAPSTVRQVRSMLESVVLEGTAESASLDGYRAAGKTGTAQKAAAGGYAANRYIASFVGFAPVKDPALVLAVVIDEPWPRYHGGEVAAPAFARMANQTLLYLGIPPDDDLPDRRWPQALSRDGAGIEGPVLDPPPEASPPHVRLAQSRIQRIPQPPGTVPDFRGLSAREAVFLSSELGLELALDGHGMVERQRPAPGTPLEEVAGQVELSLAPEVR